MYFAIMVEFVLMARSCDSILNILWAINILNGITLMSLDQNVPNREITMGLQLIRSQTASLVF